jgi:hypothetical protein
MKGFRIRRRPFASPVAPKAARQPSPFPEPNGEGNTNENSRANSVFITAQQEEHFLLHDVERVPSGAMAGEVCGWHFRPGTLSKHPDGHRFKVM